MFAGSFGALVHGPTGHYFYGMLDSKLPGTKPMTVATKVAIDQVRFFFFCGGRGRGFTSDLALYVLER